MHDLGTAFVAPGSANVTPVELGSFMTSVAAGRAVEDQRAVAILYRGMVREMGALNQEALSVVSG